MIISYQKNPLPSHPAKYIGLLLLIPLLLPGNEAYSGEQATKLAPIILNGTLIQQTTNPNIGENISAVAAKDDILVLGADEGADILTFWKTASSTYNETEPACIPLDGKGCGDKRKGKEVDIEGVAWGDKYLYVIGSHSRARKGIKKGNSTEKNKGRLATIKIEPTREQLFRLELKPDGTINNSKKIKSISLRNLFANHPILSLFQAIPSKENGIDIEGLAVAGDGDRDKLYLGFRGPVLRGNHALVMVLEFKEGKFKEKKLKKNPSIHYLNLGGRGIRGMTEVGRGGFLVLGGPVGDEATGYSVYFWDGREDDLSGVPRTPLCGIPVPADSKAEGIELLNKGKAAGDDYRFVIVYDHAKAGATTVFGCPPQGPHHR